jgi:hypothetical protein
MASIRVSFDPDSNANDESDSDHKKTPSPRNLSEAGRQIDCNDEQPESARFSIRVSFDPDSNVNDESDLHPVKDLFPRNSTDAGRQMNFNDEQLRNVVALISDSSDLNSKAII